MNVTSTSTPQNTKAMTERHLSEWRRVVKVFYRRKLAVFGLAVIVILALVAIFANWIAPYDPIEIDPANKLLSPSWQHPLGTDSVGRDTLSRLIYGARVSLIIGIAAVGTSSVIGLLMGLCAAYYRGWVYNIIMRFTDALMAMPGMVLILLITGLVGGGVGVVIVALTIGSISGKCRMMCGQALSVMQNDYILAGRVMGLGNLRMILTQVLPNAFPPILVMITMQFGGIILAEAGLSYLGVGVLPPTPSWGNMVNDGQKYLLTNPILSLSPGFAIMLVVLGFNMMGDGLRDALDPRLRGAV